MDCYPNSLNYRISVAKTGWICLAAIVLVAAVPTGAIAQRQIRTKKPDRGVYQPPSLPTTHESPRQQIQQTNFSEPVLEPPYVEGPYVEGPYAEDSNGDGVIVESYPHDLNAFDMGSVEVGCGAEAIGCDSGGCDSMGCGGSRRCGRCLPTPNGYISFSPDRWFGSIELMLMFRNGDRLPTLLTTSSSADDDTAGEIGQSGTQVLVGSGERIFKDMTAGGRLTLGTYLDNQQCRSLIFRGWLAAEKTFGFIRDHNSLPVITRPFLDVSDNQAAQQDALLITFPDRATGSISITGDSNVYGADVSVRQFWYGIEGLSIDFLYGYQFMRLDENLAIQSESISLDDDFAPVGSMIAIRDSFDIENEFHGGQIGVSSMYREGCWSFSALAKTGFGSLARRGNLQGQTRTSIDGNTAVDNQGLLVRDTNSGDRTDHTFGWVPEIDLSLGWRKFPHYEVTVGYHVIAMSDALQVSGAIDPALAVNLSDPPTGQQSPRNRFHYETFYVQGIHFGLQYVY